MGRSSAEQALQTREKIVTGASRLFRERGVEAVSVSDIMAVLGMTVGGFYKHFASKEALVAEAAAKAFEDAAAFWTRNLGSGDQEARALRARLVGQYLHPETQPPCPIIAFAPHAAGKDSGEPLRCAYDKGTGALLERFFTVTNPASVAADPDDPQTLLLFAAMIGARVLGEAAGDAPWVLALKKAVIEAAEQQV